MNVLDSIMNAENGTLVRQLGAQAGLDEKQTASALSALVPELSDGLRRNMQTSEGIGGLIAALSRGNHRRYIENPAVLESADAVAEGNGILGHVLGSKEASREAASRASAQTGLGADVLKRMLPLVATLVMGAMSRRASAGDTASVTNAATSGGLFEMLGGALDRNRDGSALDDITGMIGRTLGRS